MEIFVSFWKKGIFHKIKKFRYFDGVRGKLYSPDFLICQQGKVYTRLERLFLDKNPIIEE
jgi:hypothetical protein